MRNRPRNNKPLDEQLPVADDAGGCNDANFVGFEVPMPAKQGEENACAREVENLESQCASVFGWERFSSQLYAATDGTVAPASAIIAGEYTLVRLRETPNQIASWGISHTNSYSTLGGNHDHAWP